MQAIWLIVGALALLAISVVNALWVVRRCESDPGKIRRAFFTIESNGTLFLRSIQKSSEKYGISQRDVKTIMWHQLFVFFQSLIVGLAWAYLGARLLGPGS